MSEAAALTCPIDDGFLPQNMKKHVDPKAPAALRMMAAKGLVPLSASDMASVLFMLSFDAEAGVREASALTSSKLADRIAASAFRDEGMKPPVLGYFLKIFGLTHEVYAEMLILNASTPDDAVSAVAASCSKKIAETISQNQLRLLRHEELVRQLALNANTQGALIDGVCDFAVRSGLVLPDVPQMQAARVRIFGPEVLEKPVEQGPTAEEVMDELSVRHESVVPMEEGRKVTLSQRVQKMNIAEKIKLATKGNKEARMLLIRDSNRLVCVAVIRSPRLTDAEVLLQAQSRIASDDVLRVVYGNREWLRQYPIKLALVKNPKVPQAVSMRLLSQLHESDVKHLARDKNVPGTIQMLAKKMLTKKDDKKKSD
jgi:hypothetical protein